MCRRLTTVSPNTSFSSCVASKSFNKDGHCDAEEYERYTSPKACSREDVRSKRHRLWSAAFEDLRSEKQSKNLVSYPVHCKLVLYLCSNSCCERLRSSLWIAWHNGCNLLTAPWYSQLELLPVISKRGMKQSSVKKTNQNGETIEVCTQDCLCLHVYLHSDSYKVTQWLECKSN